MSEGWIGFLLGSALSPCAVLFALWLAGLAWERWTDVVEGDEAEEARRGAMRLTGTCVCCGMIARVDAEDGHCRECGDGQCNHDDVCPECGEDRADCVCEDDDGEMPAK